MVFGIVETYREYAPSSACALEVLAVKEYVQPVVPSSQDGFTAALAVVVWEQTTVEPSLPTEVVCARLAAMREAAAKRRETMLSDRCGRQITQYWD